MGLDHWVQASDFAEEAVRWSDFASPEEFVQTIAVGKILAARDQLSPEELANTTIIAGDLMVFWHGETFGKPHSFAQAQNFMSTLQNQTHVEVAAVCVWSALQGLSQATAQTQVAVPAFSDTEMASYLQLANPLTKAGGFDLHTAQQILRKRGQTIAITGDVSTVLGLPVQATSELLSQHGWTIPLAARTLETSLRQELGL